MIETLLEAERLLVMGMLDRAEQLYRRTADADPRNAIALVGLARVALEREDDQLAYRHACAALEIDPLNAAALRLEARLSEVMTARGEHVERPAWLDTGGAAPPSASPEQVATEPSTDLGLAAQRAAFVRNPSMADHRRMQDEAPPLDAPAAPAKQASPPKQAPAAIEPAATEPTANAPPPADPSKRPGLLRRLLGR